MKGSSRRQRVWLARIAVALLGAVAGVWIWAALLQRATAEQEGRMEWVVTRLPPQLAEISRRLLGQDQPQTMAVLEATGIIEAKQVRLASEFTGRVASVRVSEGQRVAVGDLLVELDTTLLDAQIRAAEARVNVAAAALAQAMAGVRPGQIAIAKAELNQAQVAQIVAQQMLSDTLALVENPQETRLQIAVMQMQAEAAGHRVAEATALKDAAELVKDSFEDAQSQIHEGEQRILVASGPVDKLGELIPSELQEQLPPDLAGDFSYGNWYLHVADGYFELYQTVTISIPFAFHLAPNEWWQAWVGVNAAAAEQQGLQNSLYQLYRQLEHPQLLEAQVDEALSNLAQAEAQAAIADAQLEGLRAGPTAQEIGALQARVDQAKTAVEALKAQRELQRLAAPLDGTVLAIPISQGEIASQGATLITITDLEQLGLVVYVPENRIGGIALGMPVVVTADAFAQQPFEGTVSTIADQAEFTPRNVATKEERVNLVFAVKIDLQDPDRVLKPGMPATARFADTRG
jgi:multidrug efflux pump subunit AcrA (membrane-fusion protein)